MRRMGCTEYEVHICTYNTSTLLAPRELLHLENTESERACKCERSCDFGLSCSPPCPSLSPSLLHSGTLSPHMCLGPVSALFLLRSYVPFLSLIPQRSNYVVDLTSQG